MEKKMIWEALGIMLFIIVGIGALYCLAKKELL